MPLHRSYFTGSFTFAEHTWYMWTAHILHIFAPLNPADPSLLAELVLLDTVLGYPFLPSAFPVLISNKTTNGSIKNRSKLNEGF